MESDFLRFFFTKKWLFEIFLPEFPFVFYVEHDILRFFWHKSDFLRFFHWGSCSKCTANRYHLTSTVTFWDFSWHKSDFLNFFHGSITLLSLYCTYFYLFFLSIMCFIVKILDCTCGSHRENFLNSVFDGFHLHFSKCHSCSLST